jgi:DNA-binding MarR family transcriptional regulator
MHQYGMPFQGPPILRMISKSPGITVSEISRKIGLAKSQVSSTLDKLVELGFVVRTPDPTDQRLVRLNTSALAQEHVMRVEAAVVERLNSAAAGFPPELLDALISGLEELLVALEKETSAGDEPH